MRHLLFLSVSLFLFSCTNTHTDKMGHIEFGNIKASPEKEKIIMEDLKVSIKPIRLETNDDCLLGNITQLADIDFLWIVADRQVYKFDKDGNFIEKIGQKGQGPTEYIAPQKIQIDAKKKNVYVMDYFGRKVVTYDYDGNFLKSLPLPEDYSLNNMFLNNSNLYYLSNNNSVKPDLLSCNTTTGKIDTISYRERTMGQEAFAGNTYMYNIKGNTYLYHYFNDTIYSFKNNQLTPAYFLDLGNNMFTFKQLTVIGDETSEEPIDNPKMMLSNFIDTHRGIILSYSVVSSWKMGSEPDMRFSFYDKEKQKMYPDAYFVSRDIPVFSIEDKDPIFASSDEKSIYTFKQAYDLMEEEIIEGLEDEDNPIIIQYTFN